MQSASIDEANDRFTFLSVKAKSVVASIIDLARDWVTVPIRWTQPVINLAHRRHDISVKNMEAFNQVGLKKVSKDVGYTMIEEIGESLLMVAHPLIPRR